MKEIRERAKQLISKDANTTEAATTVHLKLCVDAEWIESLIALGFMDDVLTYGNVTDEELWTYLDKKAKE